MTQVRSQGLPGRSKQVTVVVIPVRRPKFNYRVRHGSRCPNILIPLSLQNPPDLWYFRRYYHLLTPVSDTPSPHVSPFYCRRLKQARNGPEPWTTPCWKTRGGAGSPGGGLRSNWCSRFARKRKLSWRAKDSPMQTRFPGGGVVSSWRVHILC